MLLPLSPSASFSVVTSGKVAAFTLIHGEFAGMIAGAERIGTHSCCNKKNNGGLGPSASPVGFLGFERLQLVDKDRQQLVGSDLELGIAFHSPLRLEEDELNRRHCHKALQRFNAGVLPIL